MPQSSTLSLATLPWIRLPEVGPSSSVTRMPPTLSCTMFASTREFVTVIRCSPSPQSPGMLPLGEHSGVSVVPKPWSLNWMTLCWMVTPVVDPTRMPSPMAFSTVSPSTTDPAAAAPVTTIPLSKPVASTTAPVSPSSVSCLSSVTSSAYVPASTTTVSPADATVTAWPIVWHGAAKVQGLASLPDGET
jgi:hypothetical protein